MRAGTQMIPAALGGEIARRVSDLRRRPPRATPGVLFPTLAGPSQTFGGDARRWSPHSQRCTGSYLATIRAKTTNAPSKSRETNGMWLRLTLLVADRGYVKFRKFHASKVRVFSLLETGSTRPRPFRVRDPVPGLRRRTPGALSAGASATRPFRHGAPVR